MPEATWLDQKYLLRIHEPTCCETIFEMVRAGLIAFIAVHALAANYPAPVQADWTVPEFRFHDGETANNLRLHYTTIGSPSNPAVLILHGTTGSGQQFLSAAFSRLYAKGALLDAEKFFIVLPDGIGHGKSAKPSDGLHARFPKYCYHDMVTAQYRLITEALNIKHLRLVMGTSMGGMHTWLWGERYPDFMDALMPLASAPVEIAGRNRMLRRILMEAITSDPDYNNGEYTKPLRGSLVAQYTLWVMTGSPLQLQKEAPTRDAADALFTRTFHGDRARRLDPNDLVYAVDSSRDYNPAPELEKITAPLYAVNSADDQVNPPELGILEREIKRVRHGRYILLPITSETRGHGTHSLPSVWGRYLEELLRTTSLQSRINSTP